MNKENVFVIDDPSLIGWVEDGVTADGDPIWKWDQEGSSGGSAGAGMIICSEAELPLVSERVTGMQWLDSESSNVYVWDDDKWLMFPATGGQGADGAPGEVEEAPIDTKQYARQDGAWSEVVGTGTGSSVHIGDTPPVDPQEGQQWMEVPVSGDATMWIYDGANWLEQPGGKDGADGVGGGDSLWTDNGDTTISYSAGSVGIGTTNPKFSLDTSKAIYSGLDTYTGTNYGNTPGFVYLNGDTGGYGIVGAINSTQKFMLSGGINTVNLITYNNTGLVIQSDQTKAEFGKTQGIISFKTGSSFTERLTIDATGDATFSKDIKIRQDSAIGLDLLGTVSAIPAAQNHGYVATGDASAGGANGDLYIAPRTSAAASIRFVTGTTPTERLTIDATGNASFSGTARFETLDNPLMLRSGEDVYSIGVELRDTTAPAAACVVYDAWQTHYFEQGDPANTRDVIYCDGNATFSGNVASESGRFLRPSNNSGITISSEGLYPDNGTGNLGSDGLMNMGGLNNRFKDAYFSGKVSASSYLGTGGWGVWPANTNLYASEGSGAIDNKYSIGDANYRWVNCYLRGSVVSTRHGVSIGTRDLIETLSTLRTATQDEKTFEGLRDSISNAIGGLIEKFEALQSEAVTQEISDE